MLVTSDTIRWLVVAVILYLIGYELATQAWYLVRRAGSLHGRVRADAEVCCWQVRAYAWVSAGLALIAAVLGVIGIPFVEAAIWTLVVWGLATLYMVSRIARVLALASHER